MKRNPDLIRRIAQEVEALPHQGELTALDGVDAATLFHHVTLMKEAGLLEAHTVQYLSGETKVIVTGLTWEGHDFADAARSDTIWAKAKESVIAPTMSWTFAILKEWLKAEITKRLPSLGDL